MESPTPNAKARPATPARIYDYILGGIHNFPADQEAARRILELYPDARVMARANRAFLRRAIRFLTDAGIRQFLDVGSGIPSQGNVHEIAQPAAPGSRVVYVDIDPVAVAEGLELLAGNPNATSIHGDLRRPGEILNNATLRKLLDLDQPVALLIAAVLHFIPDDDRPYALVAELVAALPAGSYLLLSQSATEAVQPESSNAQTIIDLYKRQAATASKARTRAEFERFFTGLDLVDPGVVWVAEWRPDSAEAEQFVEQPERSLLWAGVARKPSTTTA
ncbi:MAG: SAM-dependent methyltransferase [Micromonosporaceae bacterium]|nr:SAM-dependent methyltransferase [Micromonosporaceae bacterium]